MRLGLSTSQHISQQHYGVVDRLRSEFILDHAAYRRVFMMGKSRGQLAVTMDVLTDALVLVGQHGVYCQSARTPGKPAMDIQMITKSISDAKDLIAAVIADLKVRDSVEKG